MPLSDQLFPTCLQNEELSLNTCSEPWHAREEGTVAFCMLLNSVQGKAASTSMWTLSGDKSGDRVEGKRNSTVCSPKCN